MDGWMDGCGLFLKALVFSLQTSMSPFILLFFLDMATPFSLFFCHASLACHLFSFWATIIRLYFISGMFYERDYQDMEHLLMGNGWVVVLIPGVEMSQMDGCVHAYDRESMKSISLGSHNLTKLNRTSSSICVKVFHGI